MKTLLGLVSQIPHVQYSAAASEQPEFKRKMVDFRWQRFVDRDLYKTLYNSFKSGKGVAAKIKGTSQYLIITDQKVIKSNSNKGLPQLPADWHNYIIVVDTF